MEVTLDETFSASDALVLHDAVVGAIGWIAAGTNEGNHHTSQHIRGQLIRIADYLTAISRRGQP